MGPADSLRWDASRASCGGLLRQFAFAEHALAEQRLGDAMDDQVGIAADGRSEVGVGGRGQRKVAFVDLGVAGLAERAQHQVAEDALLGLALDARGQLLIHARRDGNVFRDLVHARIAAAAMGVAPLAAGLDALDGQSAEAERVAEAGGQLFKLDDAAGLGLLVDAIDRGHAEVFKPGGDALVGGQHELFDEAVGPGALGLGDAAHLALLVELDDRLGQIEVDAAALFAALVHEAGQMAHAFEAGNQRGVARAGFGVAFQDGVDFGVGHARGGADDAFDNFVALDAAGRRRAA